MEKNKSLKTFNPVYQDQNSTAFTRRLQEFYKKDGYIEDLANKTISSYGRLKTEVDDNNPVIDRSNLNARERRLLELNPKLASKGKTSNNNQIDSESSNNKLSFYDSNSTAMKYNAQKSTKETRIDNMRSNIFHDKVK